jgi:hypothetical protein
MKRVVIVCNAPLGLKEGLERFRDRFLDPNDHLTTMGGTELSLIATKIKTAYIANAGQLQDYDALAVVFVVNLSDDDIDSFRLEMPGVLFVGVPFKVPRAHNKDYIGFVGLLRHETVRAVKLARALKKEFKERDSRTPLLLPVQNFKSKALEKLLVDVQKLRPSEPDYDLPLKKLISSGGLQSTRESKKKTFFENRNSVRFYGPSKAGARHGGPSGNPPHDERCLVNGYFRLGARYDIFFHYDCQYENGPIGGQFPNCHDKMESVALHTHVNIAPSDAIR